jgi:hypothetical protein
MIGCEARSTDGVDFFTFCAYSIAMRQQLIDWMAEQHNAMSLTDETLHLAVRYVDTFLTQRVPDTFLQRHGSGSEPVVARQLEEIAADRVLYHTDLLHPLCNKLKRLGITCIFVAAKVTEVTTPTATEFAEYAQVDSFSRDQLLLAERALLRELNYSLIRPTAFSFAEAYVERVLCTTDQLARFADRMDFGTCAFAMYGNRDTFFKEATYYFIELAALGHDGLEFAPSLLAAAAIAYSLSYLKVRWNEIPILEEVAGYTEAQLQAPVTFLQRITRDSFMFEEYSDGLMVNEKFQGVTEFLFSIVGKVNEMV